MPTDIVVDAMGSDKAPEPEVRGAVLAARQFDVRVHLVGPEDKLRPILRHALRGQRLPVFIAPASEWITMDDKAAQAVRAKRDSTKTQSALADLDRRARNTENLVSAILAAVEAYATVGEISDTLRGVYGEYHESVVL